MLAIIKELRIELGLIGESDEITEFLKLIRSRYTVEVLTGQNTTDDDDEYEDAFETDFWKGVTPSDLLVGMRLKHELTQEQLAEKSGIHQVVISAYETGRRKLSRRAAMKLAKAMDEDPEVFFRKIAQKQ